VFRYIEKLQKKPEHVKRWIAVFITIFLFLIIVSVWLSIDNTSFVNKKESNINKTPPPFTVLKDTFGELFGNMGDNLKNLKVQFSSGN